MKANSISHKSIIPAIFGTVLLFQSCIGPNIIRKDGLQYIRLGDGMPEPGISLLGGHVLRDTTFDEGGYSWKADVVEYSQGRVLIEEDLLEGNTVNRIRIETPELRLQNGICIGKSLADLLQKSKVWIARPFIEYRLMELTSPDFPHKIFLVKVQGFNFEKGEDAVEPESLNPNSTIVKIVLM